MGECICTSCKNLRKIIDEDSGEELYECEFGYPSDTCIDCCEGECNLTCRNFEEDTDEEVFILVNCKGCGKEIRKIYKDGNEGEVFCIDCYLKREK